MAMGANEKPAEVKLDRQDPEEIKARLLAKYPPKVARKRAKQIVVNKVAEDGKVPVISSNVRTVPGLMGQRGCCYAGCKGVVLGPTRGRPHPLGTPPPPEGRGAGPGGPAPRRLDRAGTGPLALGRVPGPGAPAVRDGRGPPHRRRRAAGPGVGGLPPVRGSGASRRDRVRATTTRDEACHSHRSAPGGAVDAAARSREPRTLVRVKRQGGPRGHETVGGGSRSLRYNLTRRVRPARCSGLSSAWTDSETAGSIWIRDRGARAVGYRRRRRGTA